jgi:hypothetical protein
MRLVNDYGNGFGSQNLNLGSRGSQAEFLRRKRFKLRHRAAGRDAPPPKKTRYLPNTHTLYWHHPPYIYMNVWLELGQLLTEGTGCNDLSRVLYLYYWPQDLKSHSLLVLL